MKRFRSLLAVCTLTVSHTAGAQNALPLFTQSELTLPALTQAVIERNAGLSAQQATARAAFARIEPAGALEDPTLSYGLAPLTVGRTGDLGQNISLSQTLPWPGKLAAREAVARAQARAAKQGVGVARLELTALAQRAYAEWFFIHRALAINEAEQDLLRRLIEVATARYAAGEALRQDVLRGELELVALEQRDLELEQKRIALQANINALLRRKPAVALPPPARLPELNPLPELETLQRIALDSHPELIRLQQGIKASRAEVNLAERAFYPDFKVMAGYNSLWRESDLRPLIGVSINLPLDQGKREATLDAAKAELLRARWHRQDRIAGLLAELAAARANALENQKTIALYRERLLPLAESTLDASLAAYRGGGGDFLDVLSAQRKVLDAQLGVARTRADYLRAMGDLIQAVGLPREEFSSIPSPPQAGERVRVRGLLSKPITPHPPVRGADSASQPPNLPSPPKGRGAFGMPKERFHE